MDFSDRVIGMGAEATGAVIETAAEIQQRGRRAWGQAEDIGRTGADVGRFLVQAGGNTADFVVDQGEQALARGIGWAANRGAEAVDGGSRAVDRATDWAADRGADVAQGARDVFGWIAD